VLQLLGGRIDERRGVSIAVKIQQLAEDPNPDEVVKTKGSHNEYHIRIGDDRVLCEISDQELLILLPQCKHREDVYRK
jgi:mRNA interferase RelE/StbE